MKSCIDWKYNKNFNKKSIKDKIKLELMKVLYSNKNSLKMTITNKCKDQKVRLMWPRKHLSREKEDNL